MKKYLLSLTLRFFPPALHPLSLPSPAASSPASSPSGTHPHTHTHGARPIEYQTSLFSPLTQVLSPGAAPIVPPFPGRELPGIFTIRNVPDTERVKDWLRTHPNTKVCEFA